MVIKTDGLVSWLQYALALGSGAAACALIREYKTPEAVLALGKEALVNLGRLSEAQAQRLFRRDSAKAEEILAICREFGWFVLTPADPRYPASLLTLSDFPLALYVRGDPGCLKNETRAAIVGTRRASEAGLGFAFRLASSLSENGVCVVSGCALGIDSAAHEGGLTAGGSTIAVLGNGFGFNYLPQQVLLRRRIEKYGALITETPPFTGPGTYSFQRRNRLISALSGSVTVVESGATGGSLITAGFARKQGKPLFVPPQEAVPSVGCGALLADGARALSSPSLTAPGLVHYQEPAVSLAENLTPPAFLTPGAMDAEAFALHNGAAVAEAAAVLRLLPKRASHPSKPKTEPQEAPQAPDLFRLAAAAEKKQKTKSAPDFGKNPEPPAPAPAGLSETQAAVFGALTETPALLDHIAASLEIPASEAMNAVSMLELMGFARTYPGNLVSR